MRVHFYKISILKIYLLHCSKVDEGDDGNISSIYISTVCDLSSVCVKQEKNN